VPVFDFPVLLALSPLVAALVGGLAWFAWRRRVRRAAAWEPSLAGRARSGARRGPWLLAGAGLLAAVALAGPRGGRAQVTSTTRSLNVVFAVDISRSMLAEDAAPNRLKRATREVRRLVQDLQGDRLGLIAFAGRSYIMTPLTIDGGAIDLYLDGLDPDLVSEGGTELAPMLAQGRQLLTATSDGADRVLVVFTDGELHDSLGAAVAEARRLGDERVHVVLVAEGGATPVRIPVRDPTGALVEYQKDQDGTVIETARDDKVLQALADAAEGTVVAAALPDQAGAVRDLLAVFKRSTQTGTASATLLPRAWIPLLVALALLVWQLFARRTAALIALAVLLGAGSADAQRPSDAERAYRQGRAAEAWQRFLAEAQRGIASDTSYFNAGTSALQAGKVDEAKKALEEASRSRDPELRYRALYNLGLLNLLVARADPAQRDQGMQAAAQYLQDALLLEPGSARAKWNLELARRHPPPPPPNGGGQSPPPQGGQGTPPPGPPKPSDLSRSQAEQILNSVEREEGMTRDRHTARTRVGSPRIKDW
jgi:Ca-activated chloride channel family protein